MKINRAISHSAAIALAVSAAFGTAPVMAADTPQEANPKFVKMDKNKDGFITRDEVTGIRWYDQAFDQADENRDGRLDRAEFIKAESIQDRMAAGKYVSDSVLTAKVKAALVREQKLKALDVNVETLGGEVQLSGFVRDESQRSKAVQVASSVHGVASVRDSLIVK